MYMKEAKGSLKIGKDPVILREGIKAVGKSMNK